ncbi:MAG: Zn-ribbon domain-containing OB-fold protein [Deltaproteobacteria bacterium]|nr:Zn-ribbon domain-containing OB-fold protein [Deltaproteobacteria bacterium]
MNILERSNAKTIKSVKGYIPVTNKYTAGLAAEEFFTQLTQGKIVGSYCEKCNHSFLPARHFCEKCFSRCETNKEAPLEGTLKTWTKVYKDLDGKDLKEPVTLGFVTFKGFKGGLIHKLKGTQLSIGARVKPVFVPKNKQTRTILDIKHFETV